MNRDLRTWRVRVPLVTPFQGVRVREATLVEGPAGWGEVSPFPGFPTDPVLAWQAAREAATTPWPEPLRAEVGWPRPCRRSRPPRPRRWP